MTGGEGENLYIRMLRNSVIERSNIVNMTVIVMFVS